MRQRAAYRVELPFETAAPRSVVRPCDWPGCAGEGSHRAPQSRERLDAYRWFCLDHVREYNAAWNYYAGMTEADVEADLRRDTVWQRPSWPLGGGQGAWRPWDERTVRDPFGLFGAWRNEAPPRRRPPTPEEEAMAVMGLAGPLTVSALKRRYKELVKRHHPDANGGSKESEEKLKDINRAYKTLLRSLTS
jgi:hypothetical protein